MANLTKRARPIQENVYSKCRVDILIPFHGQYQKVYKLCETIWKTLRLNYAYRICLIDDCSPNAHFYEGFKDAPRTLAIRNETQLGFGGALNAGLQATENPWVVIMHSDCLPHDQFWLLELIKSYENLSKSKVVMVSPRTDNPGDGTEHTLKGKHTDVIPDMVLETGFLPLYCALFNRELVDSIGGFMKQYPYAFYENEEFAYRIRKRGFKQGVSGRSWIHHDGWLTIEQVCRSNPEAKKIMEGNRDRCISDMR